MTLLLVLRIPSVSQMEVLVYGEISNEIRSHTIIIDKFSPVTISFKVFYQYLGFCDTI